MGEDEPEGSEQEPARVAGPAGPGRTRRTLAAGALALPLGIVVLILLGDGFDQPARDRATRTPPAATTSSGRASEDSPAQAGNPSARARDSQLYDEAGTPVVVEATAAEASSSPPTEYPKEGEAPISAGE